MWHRRLQRQAAPVQQVLKAGLVSRSRLIWNQSTTARRRGYFLAGVGLATGHALDAISDEANLLLIEANRAILEGDAEAAISAIIGLAERVFTFYPFTPDPLPANWRDILRAWLLGQPLAALGAAKASETLQFVEGGLVYRLPWAMEAIRVRAAANGDTVGIFGLPLDLYELGAAVPAVETGTLSRSAAILIQAGFNSRLAAIQAVADTDATFTTGSELRQWLDSEVVTVCSTMPDWPTFETKAIWMEFVRSFTPAESRTWSDQRYQASVDWLGNPPPPGTPVQIHQLDGQPWVLAADATPLGTVRAPLNPRRIGLLRATAAGQLGRIDVVYFGPKDIV